MCDYHSFQSVDPEPKSPEELYDQSPMNPKNKKPSTSTGTNLLEDSFR